MKGICCGEACLGLLCVLTAVCGGGRVDVCLEKVALRDLCFVQVAVAKIQCPPHTTSETVAFNLAVKEAIG